MESIEIMVISLNSLDIHTYINKLESFSVVEEFGPGYSAAVYYPYDLGNASLNLFQALLFMLCNEVLGIVISKDFFPLK